MKIKYSLEKKRHRVIHKKKIQIFVLLKQLKS